MPVFEEGEERGYFSAEVEPIFDDEADDDAEQRIGHDGDRGESDGPEGLQSVGGTSTTRTGSDLEDDWLFISPSDSTSDGGRTLNVLRISLDGTGGSTKVQQTTINEENGEQISRSLWSRLNFLGLFGSKRTSQNSNEINVLKNQIDVLSSQVILFLFFTWRSALLII